MPGSICGLDPPGGVYVFPKRMVWQTYIPEDIRELYEVHDYNHAAAILRNEFRVQFDDIIGALRAFRIAKQDILDKGGNESNIPKLMSSILRPRGWKEDRMNTEMVVDGRTVSADTHKVDYLKGKVGLEMEWNSKDQTYDRDIFAFRTFHQHGKISVGVIITRSEKLNKVFSALGVKDKYGASTTWIGKLLPRLDAGRQGGCPILVFGITPSVITDWVEQVS